MDNEGNGVGAMYEYGFRIYDPRIAKFLSVDPLFKSYPWYTPFQFAGNMPIWAIDLDGLEEAFATDYWDEEKLCYYRKYTLNPDATDKDKGKIQFKVKGKIIGKKIDGNTDDLRHIENLKKHQKWATRNNFVSSTRRPIRDNEIPMTSVYRINKYQMHKKQVNTQLTNSNPIPKSTIINTKFSYNLSRKTGSYTGVKQKLVSDNHAQTKFLISIIEEHSSGLGAVLIVPKGEKGDEYFNFVKSEMTEQGYTGNLYKVELGSSDVILTLLKSTKK